MPYSDSLDKIIGVYLAGVCRKSFTYKNKEYLPKALTVSPLIFRGYTCPPNCGACCSKFTLDYLPLEEQLPYHLHIRHVEVNERTYHIFSDMQKDNQDHFCHNLDKTTGRCNIHGRHPFSCDFELIRFINYEDRVTQTQKLYGRGWAMLRVIGERGAQCEMLPPDQFTVGEVTRKLGRLQKWADYFDIETWIPEITEWATTGPHTTALRLPRPSQAQVS